MRKKVFVILLQLIIILSGCSLQSDKPDSSKFKIVVPYDKFEKYISESRKQDNNIDELYMDIIFYPLYNEFISGGRYSELAYWYIRSTITQISDIENKLNLLKEENVEKIAEEALHRCNEYFPAENTTVLIIPARTEYSYLTDPMGGVLGVTAGSGKIMVLVDPTNNDWKSVLSYTIAHEYHHSIWTAMQCEYDGTILASLIFEGKADSFANIVYPEVEIPWVSAMDLHTEKSIWNGLKDRTYSRDKNLQTRVLYGDNKEFPHWFGYTIGYKIVQEFLKNNTEMSIEEWTKLDSSELYKLSGYEKRIQ